MAIKYRSPREIVLLCRGRAPAVLFLAAALFLGFATPATAFTANSLDITISTNGDATAVFSFTLEGIVENAIPESMLKEELAKGLMTSSDPPEVVTFDKSGATLLLKKFAQLTPVENGTEFLTASMDFTRAEIALKESALSYAVTADFSPHTMTVTFPDGYTRKFTDTSTLPSLTHTVIDPAKQAAAGAAASTGSIRVTSIPENASVSVDGVAVGTSPGTFTGIAPGQHAVLVGHDGFMSEAREVIVEAGRRTSVSVTLTEIIPIPSGNYGFPLSLPGFSAVPALIALLAAGILVATGCKKL